MNRSFQGPGSVPGLGAAPMRNAGIDKRRPSTGRSAAFVTLGIMLAAMWMLEGIDQLLGGSLDNEGVHPLSVDGLSGILLAPLLHANWAHLIGNTIPLLVVGSIIALSGFKNFLLVTAAGWILSGALTWLIGGTGTVHLGASGIVFAYIVYVVVRGAFTRRPLHILVGLAAAVYYGLVIVGGIVPFGNEGISWQGHLGGAIGGVFAASRLGRGKAASAR